jgi:hypothetical protein
MIKHRYHLHPTAHHLTQLSLKGSILYIRMKFYTLSFRIFIVASDEFLDEEKSSILVAFTVALKIHPFLL